MPARPWMNRSDNSDVSLRARIRYLRKSNDDLRGQLSKLNQENRKLKQELKRLKEQVDSSDSKED